MKKTKAAIAALLAVLTVMLSITTASAQLIFPDTQAPRLSLIYCGRNGGDCDIKIGVLPLDNAVEAEIQRAQVYNTFVKTYGSSTIASSDAAWSQYPFTVHFQVSADGKSWAELEKQCAVSTSGEYSVSVISDIFALLTEKKLPLSPSGTDFNVYFRAYTAPENCTDRSGEPCILSPFSAVLKVKISGINLITYILSGGENAAANPAAYFEISNDIHLGSPVRAGYIFRGWLDSNGESTGIIPASSSGTLTFTAKWEAKRYSVFYVLSQPSFVNDFSSASNSTNPTFIYSDKSAELKDIASPHKGYVLGGWYETADFSSPAITELPVGVSHDITLYAEWITIEENAKRDDAVQNAANRLGDADNDGKVTSADARLTLRHSVKLESIDEKYLARVDFFKTGIISSACARTVLRMAVGLDKAFDLMAVFGITSLE